MSTRAYRYITSRTSPNQNARNRPISGITIHWWGNPVPGRRSTRDRLVAL